MSNNINGYSISRNDLVASYIRKHYFDSTIVIIFNVQNHLEYLKERSFIIDGCYVWDNEIMIFEFSTIDEALYINEWISSDDAPFSQVWSLGKLICDNIDGLIKK
jgi:hypothetical protein